MKPKKPRPLNDRGEWRPIYEALIDGPDFQRLSSDARWLVVVLKLKCKAAGIRVIPAMHHTLQEWTGMPFERLSEAIREAIEGDWIAIEGPIAWVLRGLDFEPTLSPDNANHRLGITKAVKSLPRLEIVNRFIARNARWLEGFPEAFETPSIPPPNPSGSGSGYRDRVEEGVGGGPDWNGLELEPDEAREQFAAFARAHPRPPSWRCMIRKFGPGGTAERCTWKQLGEAILLFASSGIVGLPGEPMVIRFIDKVKQGPTPDGSESDIDRALRQAQERKAG